MTEVCPKKSASVKSEKPGAGEDSGFRAPDILARSEVAGLVRAEEAGRASRSTRPPPADGLAVGISQHAHKSKSRTDSRKRCRSSRSRRSRANWRRREDRARKIFRERKQKGR